MKDFFPKIKWNIIKNGNYFAIKCVEDLNFALTISNDGQKIVISNYDPNNEKQKWIIRY